MPVADFTDWLNAFTKPNIIWYAKRLAANDTLATNAHQAGPYVPKQFLFSIFPAIDRPDAKNPDVWFNLYIDSHADHRNVRAIWYNNRLRGGTRDEARLTNFGGRNSALLDPESTGALAVFGFVLDASGTAVECHVWVCRDETEEDSVEGRIGPVEPGRWAIWSPEHSVKPQLFIRAAPVRASCHLSANEIPPQWLQAFPSGAEIIQKTIELRPAHGVTPDVRLLRRRDCEFEIFLSVEEAVELPYIQKGFASIDEFTARAQTILQRRKARSGRSLELHTRTIFLEEGLTEGNQFSHQPESDPGKKPDFIFPSETAYKNHDFPDGRLRMLAVKTTCKDRWRQILNEADRITTKHLLTLQEGVSESQFREMTEAGVRLVVPHGLVDSYPEAVRPHLISLESFIADIRLISS